MTTKDQGDVAITADGSGGAIIAWNDRRNGTDSNIFAQHVLTSGAVDPSWPANGRALCSATNQQVFPVITSDLSGGAIVAWYDFRSGTNYDIYAQHVQASGAVDPGWPVDGRAVCTAAGNQIVPVVVDDGAHGAIVAWSDIRSGTSFDIYAQHVLASGAIDSSWPTNGQGVCVVVDDQADVAMVGDGSGGAIVTWDDRRNLSDYNIYAQHLLGSGVADPSWPANGRALCTAAGDQGFPVITRDAGVGAVVAWDDFRNGANFDIYAQHVLPTGAVDSGWPADGRAICTASNDQVLPAIVTDGSGGGVIAWADLRNNLDYDIYSEHVQASGVVDPAWPAQGTALCTSVKDQSAASIVTNGGGGAIVGWQDLRNGLDSDIYSQRVLASGVTVVAVPPAVVSFRLYAPRPNPTRGGAIIRLDLPVMEEVSIAIFDPAGRQVRVLASGSQLSPGEHQVAWDGADDAGVPLRTGAYFVRVRAGANTSVYRQTVLR